MPTSVCQELARLVGPRGYNTLCNDINLRPGDSFRVSENGWIGDGSPKSVTLPVYGGPQHVVTKLDASRPQSVYKVWNLSVSLPLKDL